MKFERKGNDNIPVETENDMWINTSHAGFSLADILEKAKEKWPDVSLEDISIESVNHHEYAVGYDLYDSSDYVQYIYLSIEK